MTDGWPPPGPIPGGAGGPEGPGQDDPERLQAWQVAVLTLVGAAVLLVLALFGLTVVVVTWWLAATGAWLVRLAMPEGSVRRAARRRGRVRTALWAPLIGPFALGAAIGAAFESIG